MVPTWSQDAVSTGGVHLFYYISNLAANDQAIDAWRKHAHLLDLRAKPWRQMNRGSAHINAKHGLQIMTLDQARKRPPRRAILDRPKLGFLPGDHA